MVLAARIRETLGIPGMTVEQTIPFRDKERMKQVLDAAGIRTPHHYRCTTAVAVRGAAERIGFPIIVKPIAGAGSADTYRVDSPTELESVLPKLVWVDEVSVEEFVEATEYTYDTICSRGEVLFDNVAWYRPRPLIARQLEWISPVTMVMRDIDAPELSSGRAMGRDVLRALQIPRRVHAHGVVPARQRRGGVRRDRSAPTRRSHRRCDEFRRTTSTCSSSGPKRSSTDASPSRSTAATMPRPSSNVPRDRDGSRTSTGSRGCSPITMNGSAPSTLCRSERRGATG